MGWVRGDNVPTAGTYFAAWQVANPNVTFEAGHTTATFTADDVFTYTAIWGSDGVVGGGNLIINNVPAQPVRPQGQTFNQTVEVGERVTLAEGTAPTGLEFMGWVRGDNVPTVGTEFGPWQIANPGVTFPQGHQTDVFAEDDVFTYTAIWGTDGIVGGANLIINNVPAQPVRPQGQTSSQMVEVGERVTLVHGTAPTGLEFMGWVRGDTVPSVGTEFTQWQLDNPGVTFPQGHTTAAFATGDRFVYTAIWGTGGVVGGGNLIIGNVPEQAVRPQGQTPSQMVEVGQRVTLTEGTAPTGLEFLGWVRGSTVPAAGDNWEDWQADNPNVTFGEGHETAVFAADTVLRYTAIWGRDGIVGGANLIIDNVPTLDPLPTTQTRSQIVPVGEHRILASGIAPEGLEFLGWVRGTNVPTEGDNWAEWQADNLNVVFGNGHLTQVFEEDTVLRYTAIWGRYGVVGGANLIINNVPEQPVRPQGQTPNQIVGVGNRITLEEGTAPANLEFMGWVRGLNVPADGRDFAAWQVENPGVTFQAGHQSAVFTANDRFTYTAIWGRDGIVGGGNLIINNVPGQAVRPQGQTESQRVAVGTSVTLVEGTAPASLEFMGWVRGSNVPADGRDFAAWQVANPGVTFEAGHQSAVFTADDRFTYTAIWGRDGIVGGGNLIINNVPAQAVRPIGQTENQLVEIGDTVTLVEGTAPTNLEFMGWVRGPNVPGEGKDFADWQVANPGVTFEAGHTTAEFEEDVVFTYTAIWGRDGIVGGGNLIINNVPAQVVRPTGQTPSQRVPLGEDRVLVQGAAPIDLEFMGWVRGSNVPEEGTNWIDWQAANPDVTFEAGHRTTTFTANLVLTYTAIWGRDGIVGGANLVVNNLPAFTVRPTGQTPSQIVEPPLPRDVELVHGTPVGTELVFLGWVRGDKLPEIGSNISDFDGDLFGAGHVARVPETGRVIYTAIWGSDGGDVGTHNNNLIINNHPEKYPIPAGQTPSQVVENVPTTITLEEGESYYYWEFLGWVSGTDLPEKGTHIDDFDGNVFEAGHIATIPATGRVIYTAIWGSDGIVGKFTLTINNVPEYLVEDGPAPVQLLSLHPMSVTNGIPYGQYPHGSSFRLVGSEIELRPGTRNADNLEFLGWWRGTENVPGPGDNVADFANSPNFEAPEDDYYSFVKEARATTYNALWGCEAGYVGGDFMLTVGNVPGDIPLTGQTPSSGPRAIGAPLTWTSGTPVESGWHFLGWTDDISDIRVGYPGGFEVVVPPATMPSGNLSIWAVWGDRYGNVGVRDQFDLNVANYPADIVIIGQSPQSGSPVVGTPLTWVEGTPVESGWYFLGWTDDVSGIVLGQPGGFTVVVPPTTMPAEEVTIWAVWGDSLGRPGMRDFNIYYRPNPQRGGLVSDMPANKIGRPAGIHDLTMTPAPTHSNINRDGVPTAVLFVGWSLAPQNRIFGAGEYDLLPARLTQATIVNANVEVHAIWGWRTLDDDGPADVLRDVFSITYHGNGQLGGTVSGVPATRSNLLATTHELSSGVPTHSSALRDGVPTNVVFHGWSIVATTQIFAPTDTVIPAPLTSVTITDANVNVYAVWVWGTCVECNECPGCGECMDCGKTDECDCGSGYCSECCTCCECDFTCNYCEECCDVDECDCGSGYCEDCCPDCNAVPPPQQGRPGDQGPPGDRGPAGPAGPAGAPGADARPVPKTGDTADVNLWMMMFALGLLGFALTSTKLVLGKKKKR
jgi:hypothetical protein